MSYGRITTETMTDIADAIREKTDSEEQVTPTQMPERIRSIQTGSPDAVLYVEQELTEEEKAQARENISAVGEDDIPIVPADISAFNNDSDYQTAQDVQTTVNTAIGNIPNELPAVNASDNGKVLGVVNGAWAVKSDSDNFVLLHADSSGYVYNGTTAITGAQIYAFAEEKKAVFLWDEDGEYLYAFNTVYNGDVYFTAPYYNGNGAYIAVISLSNNECSFSSHLTVPRVSESDNGKFLRVVSGAWAAQTVPSAEGASF